MPKQSVASKVAPYTLHEFTSDASADQRFGRPSVAFLIDAVYLFSEDRAIRFLDISVVAVKVDVL